MFFMKLIIISIICILCESNNEFIRVMSFNIWNSGTNVVNGLEKIAKHIKKVDPDIVALQECYVDVDKNISSILGSQWRSIQTSSNTAILTKHTMIEDSIREISGAVGVQIATTHPKMLIDFWCVHLDYRSYGPYAANNKLVTKPDQIMQGELMRWEQIRRLLEVRDRRASTSIIAGDFNSPSHLDWTFETIKQHGNWWFLWPASRTLDAAGYKDTFRQLYPDVTKYPGITWSTVNKFNPEWGYTIPEPQDRIDMIYQKGLKPINARKYAGKEKLSPIPYHQNNDYPSDHFAIYTDFVKDK